MIYVIAITPTTDLSRALVASALGHLGRAEEARQVWRELKEINPRYPYSDHFRRLPFRNPAEADKFTGRPAQGGPGRVMLPPCRPWPSTSPTAPQ